MAAERLEDLRFDWFLLNILIAFPILGLSFTHISLLTEVLTVINLAAIFNNTVHVFELSTKPNENTIKV